MQRVRETREWDILIVGGGATGLGCAVDAASRGHSVLLLEDGDFAQGTSSRSTKLIHGGLRYLAQGRVGLVREALRERWRLLENAPHLVRPLRFAVPLRNQLERVKLALGLTMYDFLAGQQRVGRHALLGADAARVALPAVRGQRMCGAATYWDAGFDDARLAIALMRTTFDHGGVALNYMAVEGLLLERGHVRGVRAVDRETGCRCQILARAVVNATGPRADLIRRMEDPGAERLLQPSQGAHVVVDRAFFPGEIALLVPETRDGRVLFVIPWQGRVLIGTTDTQRDDLPTEARALPGEVDFLLDTVARYLVRPPGPGDVRSVFCGLRPLLRGSGNTAALSREHAIERSPGGVFTIAGGKWTTYRKMAEDTIDAVEAAGQLAKRSCITSGLRLHGANERSAGADVFGSDREVVEGLPGAGRPLGALQTAFGLPSEAEVRFAARAEMARTLADVLARRHRTLFLDVQVALTVAPAVARVLADELGWARDRLEAEVAAFRKEALAMLPDRLPV
jgi:glycerol-3-phosphate dehydrogenase